MFSMFTLGSMNKEKARIHGLFRSIIELTLQMDKTPKKFGTNELMTHTEIHLIEMVGEMPGSSVTDIAGHLGVTKGAVSQNLKKLEKKGFAQKEPDPDNLSRVIVGLTAKGQTAFWAHKHWHETMDGGFLKYLEDLDDQSFGIILEFLEKTEDFLRRRLVSDR